MAQPVIILGQLFMLDVFTAPEDRKKVAITLEELSFKHRAGFTFEGEMTVSKHL
jgi:hypothetical protein